MVGRCRDIEAPPHFFLTNLKPDKKILGFSKNNNEIINNR